MMCEERHLSRTALLWLIIAQLAVFSAFWAVLPLWLFPVLLFTAGWRYRIVQRHWQYPSRLVKVMAVALSVAGIAVSDINPLSLDAATLLLLLGFALKNLEMLSRRDGILTIYIGYFLVATSFLFSQTFLATVGAVVVLTLLTAALIGLHLSRSSPLLATFKLALGMLLVSLPLMAAGYLFFPRIPPLWAVPAQQNQARTGISDTMSPGDIASIAGSGALAFRATFTGTPPSQVDRYWRGPVLTHFDGNTWTPALEYVERRSFLPDRVQPPNAPAFNPQWQLGSGGSRYSVLYEPSDQYWAFSLTPSQVRKGPAMVGNDFQVITQQKMNVPLRLDLEHFPDALLQPTLSDVERAMALQLPAQSQPRTLAWMQNILATSPSDEATIMTVLRWFQESLFYYTLKPGTLDRSNSIDAFLFDSKRGFCAHYASAFAVMMRMAGIPARVITGYQGGEWNEQGQFIAVHQFDAHAWVELWLPGRGWLSFDPTAWVAPERIEQNLRTAVADEGSFLQGSPFYALQFSWLNQARLRFDAWQYQWQRWIMDYDQQGQSLFISRWFGQLNSEKAVMYAIGFMTLLGLFWVSVLGLLKPAQIKDPMQQQWTVLTRLLKLKGIGVPPDMTPLQLRQALDPLSPQQRTVVSHYLELLNQTLYQQGNSNQRQLRQSHRLVVKNLQPSLWNRLVSRLKLSPL